MNPPAEDMEIRRDKIGEEKEGGPSFHCDLYDTDLVHKIAEALLPGLASACVDNTTGGLSKSPASVAVDIRREMVDYLVQRSEHFVAESVVLEGGPAAEVSENPFDTISDFVDDFASSKRNFFSRVSGWVLSERREDRIDDLVQEMEINGFWLLNRRESVAQMLLKNIDFKNIFHCGMKFKSLEELEEHKSQCTFRTMTCYTEGCDATFSAAQMDHHDSICPFKILPCEQNCSDHIMRREMDRHCITVCPMKLVKCPFYSVGCQSTVHHVKMDQHRSENLPSHLLYILQVIHKEASPDDLKGRVEELEKLSSPGKLAESRDARSLSVLDKDLEAKLRPLKVNPKPNSSKEVTGLTDRKPESPGLPINEDGSTQSPSKKEESSHQKEKSLESPAHINEKLESQLEKEKNVNSPVDSFARKDKSVESPTDMNEKLESKVENEELKEDSVKAESSLEKDKSVGSPVYTNEQIGSQLKTEECIALVPVEENSKESPVQREEGLSSPIKVEAKVEKLSERLVESPIKEELAASPKKKEERQ
ncbi:TNF receptor-associated factor family protein DDB_G0290965-like [Olea europaea var. sylvestris]|uniref:TNF receptor-associated factor family protein DDB_G0290965-like n=1 Tax=Olea europaea var. sylvestris TaxID=158386 RepID=UPI000C1CD578|nr:TNF receptor-associated factor family protein DDB_G0290965-like [Olea europaea var. sylvestris]XP_022851559.1 TNF receptor-associated factor family protein DDB_G0290965-like [Olea europaea var. sylvestris]XP_022851560.1 TNF receptor-associated factor family protein DDB_G0290965-like [Olea europaea var. sylvestris]